MISYQKKIIINWLWSGLLLVILMIAVGGITRLTQSGLSMVDWKLIEGTIPPLNEGDWEEEFNKYKQYPEFQKINYRMTLPEFKKIFFWEYIHRLLGRVIGIVFIIPFVFFWYQKWINNDQKKRFIILLFLGAFQAFLGWFMVKSGLVDVPAVDHLRLAAHLCTAFFLACYIYWLILDNSKIKRTNNNRFKKLSISLIFLLSIQIVFGAFTAGLKAGYLIDRKKSYIENIFGNNRISGDEIDLFNNPYDVQFIHKIYAWIIFFLIIYLYKNSINTIYQKNVKIILLFVLIQLFLGLATFLCSMQISLAVAHQVNAIMLLLSIVHLYFTSTQKSRS